MQRPGEAWRAELRIGHGIADFTADSPHQLGGLLVATEAGHDVRALDQRPHRVQQLQRFLQAYLGATIPGGRHGRAHVVGDGDAWYLVVQELGVARGV